MTISNRAKNASIAGTGVRHRLLRWYTRPMPTTLKRTAITHTPQITRLLDIADKEWPAESPREQMVKLMEKGAKQIELEDAEWKENVRKFLSKHRPYFDGIDSVTFKELSRAEWPE